MARLQSTQKPTTLLTLKKSKQLANDYTSTGEIILITEQGIIDGDVRFTAGEDNQSLPVVPGAIGLGTYSLYPVGSIIYFAGDAPPDGFLACDGGTYTVLDYPELARKLYNSNYGTGAKGQFSGAYPYIDGNSSNDYRDATQFRIPDFSGRFVRSLNKMGSLQNSNGPDYWKVDVDRLGFWNNQTQTGTSRTEVDRYFGDEFDDMYLRHRHKVVDDDVSNNFKTDTGLGGAHSHRYYGSPRSSYYVDRDGQIMTNDLTGTALGDNGDGFGRQLGNDSDDSTINYFVNFGVWSRDIPGEKNSAHADYSGEHHHFGFLGFGSSYDDTNNTTTLKSKYDISESQNNALETRPINYSVLFCIKY
jgi:hypothetical protein